MLIIENYQVVGQMAKSTHPILKSLSFLPIGWFTIIKNGYNLYSHQTKAMAT